MSDDIWNKIEAKLDKISEDVIDIKLVQVRHDENLKEHMHRSELLEERTDIIFAELEPIKAHISQTDGALKFMGILGTVTTIVLGILRFFGKI